MLRPKQAPVRVTPCEAHNRPCVAHYPQSVLLDTHRHGQRAAEQRPWRWPSQATTLRGSAGCTPLTKEKHKKKKKEKKMSNDELSAHKDRKPNKCKRRAAEMQSAKPISKATLFVSTKPPFSYLLL